MSKVPASPSVQAIDGGFLEVEVAGGSRKSDIFSIWLHHV
jgi:hypothetical protein